MKVAVIIVNYNDVDDTEKYVNTITKYDSINRIVVVDNMSTIEGTFEKLQKLESSKVKVIRSDKNGGYNYGNNFGIRYLQSLNEEYDYYIISNPDIYISEKSVQNCLKLINQNTQIGIIAPRMFNKDNNPIRRSSWKVRTFWLDVVHSTRVLEILFYVNYHMQPFFIQSEKSEKKWKEIFGEEKYNNLLIFNECDKIGSGTHRD